MVAAVATTTRALVEATTRVVVSVLAASRHVWVVNLSCSSLGPQPCPAGSCLLHHLAGASTGPLRGCLGQAGPVGMIVSCPLWNVPAGSE